MNSFDHTNHQWWTSHDNLVTLTAWMANNNYQADNLAHAVEKPWAWESEFLAAKYDLDEFDLMEVTAEFNQFEGSTTMELLIQARAAANAAMEAGS